MDLDDISAEQAQIDLGVANARIVELSCQIELASSRVLRLRQELERLQRGGKSVPAPDTKMVSVGVLDDSVRPAPGRVPLVSVKRISLSRLLRRRVKPLMLMHIDEVCGRPLVSQGGESSHVVSVREFRSITISGWAAPRGFAVFFSSVEVTLKGESRQLTSRVNTFARDDVAKHFGSAAILQSGFKVDFETATISPGRYVVELRGETSEGKAAVATAFTLTVQ